MWVILCGIFAITLAFAPLNVKDIPVIGILSKPLKPTSQWYKGADSAYIEERYSLYLRASGANVIPIAVGTPEAELRSLLKKINGLYFTGGRLTFVKHSDPTQLTEYAKTAQILVNIAKEINEAGEYFPVWGTCLGFQLLSFLACEDPKIPKYGCDCIEYNARLIFQKNAEKSRMFQNFSDSEKKEIETYPMTYNWHHYYVDVLDYANNPKLADMFNILTMSLDSKGKMPFISSIEGKHYPFYGTQFHPELKTPDGRYRISGLPNYLILFLLKNLVIFLLMKPEKINIQ